MFSRISFIFLVFTAIPFANGSNLTELSKQFSTSFAQELKKHSIPGAAYAIVKNDRIIAMESFGYIDKAQSQKVNGQTIFRLASVSKLFAAIITTMQVPWCFCA
jgi:beta-lactamase class C